jgi:hypothetical protein
MDQRGSGRAQAVPRRGRYGDTGREPAANAGGASATVRPTCCNDSRTLEIKGSLIADVTFGSERAITAVTQIEFEV